MLLNNTTQEIPYGYCHCGCGQKTQIAKQDNPKMGYIKGKPYLFTTGHYKRAISVEIRFWDYVVPKQADECWEWQGPIGVGGYGRMKIRCRDRNAHRISWEIHFGPIPDGLFVCHKCDNRKCCNPNHLFLGTPADNSHDMMAKGRFGGGANTNPRKGEKHSSAKLTDADIIAIRELAAKGMFQAKIAERYGITQVNISKIVLRKIWKHVP